MSATVGIGAGPGSCTPLSSAAAGGEDVNVADAGNIVGDWLSVSGSMGSIVPDVTDPCVGSSSLFTGCSGWAAGGASCTSVGIGNGGLVVGGVNGIPGRMLA